MMNSEKLFEFIAADTGFYFLTKNFGDQKKWEDWFGYMNVIMHLLCLLSIRNV